MFPDQALLVFILCAPLITTGQANLPTLPEAVQMFQLESMNNLKEVIRSQEKVMVEQQARMAELEEEHAAKELAIASITE